MMNIIINTILLAVVIAGSLTLIIYGIRDIIKGYMSWYNKGEIERFTILVDYELKLLFQDPATPDEVANIVAPCYNAGNSATIIAYAITMDRS